jgi:TetR/AcrR family transcriptional repressor of nem operon
VLAALGSELGRADAKTREAATDGFLRLTKVIASQLKDVPPQEAEKRAMAIAAAMVGAMTISRLTSDTRISNSILSGTKDHILKSAFNKR